MSIEGTDFARPNWHAGAFRKSQGNPVCVERIRCESFASQNVSANNFPKPRCQFADQQVTAPQRVGVTCYHENASNVSIFAIKMDPFALSATADCFQNNVVICSFQLFEKVGHLGQVRRKTPVFHAPKVSCSCCSSSPSWPTSRGLSVWHRITVQRPIRTSSLLSFEQTVRIKVRAGFP